jgi:hypothetical protein
MARFPDYTAVGERLPQGDGTRVLPDQSAEILADAVSSSSQRIGSTIDRVRSGIDEFDLGRAQTAFQAAQAVSQARLEGERDFTKIPGMFEEDMTKARETASKMIRSDRARALFEQRAEMELVRGRLAAQGIAKQREGDWGRAELATALDASYRAALETQDPVMRESIAESVSKSIRGAVDAGYIDEEAAGIQGRAWTTRFGEGYVATLPDAKKLEVLRKPKGTPADFIDPAKRASMIERLEDKQRIIADRREAAAERAIAQVERQIASGVPATDRMWKEWRSTIAGTSLQGELNQLLAGEKEVQDVLRKPIAEQLRFVQTREAALKTSGGTLAQAANLERLRNAVKQNITTLQTAPLLYAENRMDEPTEPLDVTSILNQDSLPAARATFMDRADKIAGISKSVGAPVPMLPLLPQEATQLAEILDKASPGQAAVIFAGLSEAAGSQEVFRGAMRQVAPDSPVKSMAGMLAAQQRELTTKTHWFSPDETVRSRDVATTLLQGERILNPSKGDKTQDGKPQGKNIYLPDADSLQSEFGRVVGNAFAGRERAADVALQAVRAYYVGRAAQTGRVARDNQDVDTNLVREAVKATLGNVVDYNGNGSVLAPWGMAEDDFEDRAERALIDKAKELNLPDSMDLDSFGLSNAGNDGEYVVTLGNNLLLDPSGNPIFISLAPKGPARGVIHR